MNRIKTCPRSICSLKSLTVRSGRRLTSTGCEPSDNRFTKSFTIALLAMGPKSSVPWVRDGARAGAKNEYSAYSAQERSMYVLV